MEKPQKSKMSLPSAREITTNGQTLFTMVGHFKEYCRGIYLGGGATDEKSTHHISHYGDTQSRFPNNDPEVIIQIL